MSAPAKLVSYHNSVFRVFSTAHPTQDLLDDLLENDAEREVLKPLFYSASVPASMDRLERVLQRSTQEIVQKEIQSKFTPEKWSVSRFSDGTWPVLYSAETPQTAEAESLHHRKKFYREELEKAPVSIDLCRVELSISTKCAVDLTTIDLDKSKLTSIDESGYPYCQRLAKAYRKSQAQLLRSYSARDLDGICVPIFDRQIIAKDSGPLNYLKVVFYPNRSTEVFTLKS